MCDMKDLNEPFWTSKDLAKLLRCQKDTFSTWSREAISLSQFALEDRSDFACQTSGDFWNRPRSKLFKGSRSAQ